MELIFSQIQSTEVFFILVIVILFFLCLVLLERIKVLKRRIHNLELENKNILERKVIKNDYEDLIPIQNISTVKKENISSKGKDNCEKIPNVKQKLEYVSQDQKGIGIKDNTYPKDTTPSNKIPLKKLTSKEQVLKREKESNDVKAYQKNILQNKNRITSPVSISQKESFDIDKLSFDLNEFIKRSERVVPKIEESPKSKDYLKAISDQLANELKPQTIELTDYEKEQEEHAIISYQELLQVKDKLTMEDDDEEDVDFIEELKNFRDSLN